MTTIIKTSTPGGFLGLLPAVLGYQPTDSLVVVPMHKSRSVGAMRLDNPPAGRETAFADTAWDLAERVPDTDAFILVNYRTGEFDSKLLRVLSDAADRRGLVVNDAILVADEGFVSIYDPTRTVHPLDAIPSPPAEAPVRPSNDIEPLPEPDLTTMARFTASIPHVSDPMEGRAIVEFAEHVATGDLDPADCARLAVYLSAPAARDIMIVHWASGRGDEALDAQRAWSAGAEDYPEDLAAIMYGKADRPSASRLRHVLENVRIVAGLLPGIPGPLAVAAWLSWALGHSTHAEQYARRGQAAQAEHGLCGIVVSFVQAGHLPDWAFAERP